MNQSIIISKYRLYGCINVAPGHNNTPVLNVTNLKLRPIPFTATGSENYVVPIEARLAENDPTNQSFLNNSNQTAYESGIAIFGAEGYNCSGSLAIYNYTVIGSAEGIHYMIEAYAKNASNDGADFTNNSENVLAAFQNVTITGDTVLNLTLYNLVGNYYNTSIAGVDVNASLMKVNIINESNVSVTSGMHVEVEVNNSNVVNGTTHYIINNLINGTFYLPILNNSDWARVSVFPNDAPPMIRELNLSLAENNITLVSIDYSAGGDKGIRHMNASGDLEIINVSETSFTLRFLKRGTETVLTEMGIDNFNPFQVMVAGNVDLEIKINATNVTMKFNNFDIFSARQPPMFAIIDNSTINSTTGKQWIFGNFVSKDLYDNVTLIIPYNATVNETMTYNISIRALFDEDLAKTHQLKTVWNSSDHTTSNLSDYFIEYNNSRYSDFLLTGGIECSKTNASHPCYMNTSNNEFIIEIPHFSGQLLKLVGYPPTTTSAEGGGGGGRGAYWTKTVIVKADEFEEGYTKELKEKERLRFEIDGESHYVGVTKLTETTATINVSSDPIEAVLQIGDERKFDVTEDGYYDVYVKLNDISNNKADITIKSIRELVTEETEALEEEKEAAAEEKKAEETKEETKKRLWLWIIIIVIVVIIAIATGWSLKKRKNY